MPRRRAPASVEHGSTLELRVEALSAEARALGRTAAGDPVELAGALPGERVRLQVEHVGRDGKVYGRLLEILEPSPERRPPACPHFGRCGGCDLLHAELELQHDFKRQRVAAALGLPLERVDPVVASPEPLGYRALAKLVVGPDALLGSYRPGTHEVTDMSGCLVHHPLAEALAEALRAELAAIAAPELRYALLRVAVDAGALMVVLVVRSLAAPGPRLLAERLAGRPEVARIVLHQNDAPGDALLGPGPEEVLFDRGLMAERLGGVAQNLEAGAFAQVNPGAAARLYAEAARAAAPAGATILELYAGSGGLTLTLLARGAARVMAVEAVEAAAWAARASIERAGFGDRAEVRAARVEDALGELRGAAFDVLVVNPPRKGISEAARTHLAAIAWRRLVYVSCNPDTLARDLTWLGQALPLEITGVVPVDLFPQTRHIETVLAARRG